MSALARFLERNSAKVGKPLPIVHSTKAYYLEKILSSQKIDTIPCDVFEEDLAYFFVGRPAYKWESAGEATEWELPVCFVFEYDVHDAKRIFPFDTGAYHSRFPSYLNMMKMDEFDVSRIKDAPERLIGTFFSSPRHYYLMKPRAAQTFEDEFLVDVLDAEVKALHKLWSSPPPMSDDRRGAIEVQFAQPHILRKGDLLAVVLPDVYLEHKAIRQYLAPYGAKLYGYSIYSLNAAAYFSQIYNYIKHFYQKRKLLNV